MAQLSAADLLFTQGFGSRRACAALVASGAFTLHGQRVDDPHALIPIAEGEAFCMNGEPWAFYSRALLLLHKPSGYECSQRPGRYPSVLSLLPAPLRQRGRGGVQCVGRLDADTTGLLLLTDDGALLHRLTSPKHHVPKVYEVQCKHAVSDGLIAALQAGVVLADDPVPVRAEHAERTGERSLTLTLTQGKYHQVKRMVAAGGNRVEGLHRSAIGALALPADLPPGQWRWITPAALQGAAALAALG